MNRKTLTGGIVLEGMKGGRLGGGGSGRAGCEMESLVV